VTIAHSGDPEAMKPVFVKLQTTNSVSAAIAQNAVKLQKAVAVGSAEKKALWQEMGTSRIPPRPVVALAMKNTLPYAADVFGDIAVALLTGKK
jgi:hypothetical protein